ncbi:pentapeptide repeat-containing protein [Streptomyces sp. CC224B]|uniref:pentapeptide repeat-containing protein n=1 Tax=Streptomyces sp. CC224B TaxID=3044571 RepID=UPI0024A87EA9|nr:pentapeptide repeat-containing protein [Streptomyces sp. CC224B]
MPTAPWAAAALRAWADGTDTYLDVVRLDLSATDLSGADTALGLVCEADLRGARLIDTDLYRAHLEGAVLDEADLTGPTHDTASPARTWRPGSPTEERTSRL